MAGAGKITIAEAEHIVDEIPPHLIHTPGVFVDRIIQGKVE
jgi:3-oxoacid CoA-transferase subunit A